ncbi:hypothetical protein [Staphylococcus saprophyticus]|uniref:hypothetical protein n=1 Tax=Staphylococcus saprophyticus TaxID=29385 RepID=UPI0034C6A7B1
MYLVEEFLKDLTKIKLVVSKDSPGYMEGKDFLDALDTNDVTDISNLDINNFEDWFLFNEIRLQWYIFTDDKE